MMCRKVYLCKVHISFHQALEVHKFRLTLKPTIWAQDGSRPAKGFVRLGRLSDYVQQETPLYFFLNTFQTLQFSKTKIALFWPWNIQGQSSSLLPVTADLPSGCEQAEMSISTKTIDLNAQERETPGKYKLLLLYQQICFYFPMPFSKASSLPEDLDCNTVVPLNSLQLEAM